MFLRIHHSSIFLLLLIVMVLNSSLQQLKLNEAARPKRVKPIVDVDHLFSNNSQPKRIKANFLGLPNDTESKPNLVSFGKPMKFASLYALAKSSQSGIETRKKSLQKLMYDIESIDELWKLNLTVIKLDDIKENKTKNSHLDSFSVGSWAKSASSSRSWSSSSSSKSNEDQQRKQVTVGKCDPKLVCIVNPLILTITSTYDVAFPACVSIHRCGGCCFDDIDSECKPNQTEIVTFGGVAIIDTMTRVAMETTIQVENHTKCACGPKWNGDDDCKKLNANFIYIANENRCGCPQSAYTVTSSLSSCNSSPYHEFDENSCKCICKKNKYETEKICRKNPSLYWNEKICDCEEK